MASGHHVRRALLLLVGAAGALGVAAPAPADVLVPKSGPKVRGVIVRQTATEVVFNPYWSRNPEMTYEVIHLTPDQVKKVDVEPHPEVEVFRRLKARKAGDMPETLAIGAYARDHKLKAHAEMCWALALAEDPTQADALKGIGGVTRFATLKKGNLLLDPDLLAALRKYVAEDDARARPALGADLKTRGFAAKPEDLERFHRSAKMAKGYQEDVPLSWHSDLYPGAVYTIYVPDPYDPAFTWPLIIGLHGGGADGKAGDEVVGDGPSAMNFYRILAAKRGFIVACPTALVAGWDNKINEEMVRDLITELRLLYDVDVDRIYMTGHSMGGGGTWALGPKMAEMLAAISPMAGWGGSGVDRLVETRTPIFIYHSADDKVVGVSSDRQSAKRLEDTDLDFIYTELDGKGHGFPDSVQLELFDFFEPRRNFDPAYKETWPRSSFLAKVTKEEKTYLGDPLDGLSGVVPDLDAWIACLRTGGGRALTAARKIAEQKPVGAAEAVARVLHDPKTPFQARAFSARALGLLADAAGAGSLRKAVATEASKEQSLVAVECARALVALKDVEAGPSLGRAVETWTQYYEGKAGAEISYSDWTRSVSTLAAVVDAWGTLAADGNASLLAKSVVARVFTPQHKVQTSDRVPQNPSETRTALARAVGNAYRLRHATADQWDELLKSLSNDEQARSAASAARSSGS